MDARGDLVAVRMTDPLQRLIDALLVGDVETDAFREMRRMRWCETIQTNDSVFFAQAPGHGCAKIAARSGYQNYRFCSPILIGFHR